MKFDIFKNLTDDDKKRVTPLFLILCVIYTCFILISNIIAGKIFMVGNLILPAAVILFPITYILSDCLTECYGFKLSLIPIKMNAIMNLLMSVIFIIAIYLPPAPFWPHQNAMASILGITWRICIFSIIGNFVGDYINSAVISIMKVKQNGKWFAVRSIISSCFGEIADTAIFIFGSFIGSIPLKQLFIMMTCQYIVKIVYEVACLPLTCKVVSHIKSIEGDYFDVISKDTYKL